MGGISRFSAEVIWCGERRLGRAKRDIGELGRDGNREKLARDSQVAEFLIEGIPESESR